MSFKNNIEIIEADSVHSLQDQINEHRALLPVTRDIKDICFQVSDNKFYAALTIGELEKKNKKDDDEPKGKAAINLMGG